MPNPGFSGPDDPRLVAAGEAYARLGRYDLVAAELGIPYGTAEARAKRWAKWQDAPQGQQAAILHSGLDIGIAKAGWRKIKNADGTADSVYWRAADDAHDTGSMVEALREGLAALPPAAPMTLPTGPSDLCAVFPVADLHIGMLADAEEVGTDWDSKKAAAVFADTFGKLVAVTPSAGTAILAQLGDLMHVDDQRNVTPQSGHQLDADTRFFMILRRAVAAMKWAIDALRAKYPHVIYRGVRGNHDLTAHHAVTLALSEHYRDTPGVTIIANAGEFYVYEFGRNMVLLHHGDRAKPDRLVHFAAAEWPEIWGRTRHRIALSGHVHHDTRKEIGGMAFESVGTIIPKDVHAYSNAYSARRGMVSIVLDTTAGEVSRARIGV